jgi:uncharacterized protein (TIGR02246 family)
MMNQPQKRDESQILSVLTIFCYAFGTGRSGRVWLLAARLRDARGHSTNRHSLFHAALVKPIQQKRRKKMKTPTTILRRSSTLAIFTLLILGFSINAYAQNGAAADEAVLRDNVKYLETGWNTKSGALFAKPFAEDADYVVINGMYIKGHATIETAHQRIFDTIYKDTNINLTVKQIRFLRPDVAVVHVTGHRVGPTKELTQNGMLTLVMTKEKQGWTIAAFQNTAIAARD